MWGLVMTISFFKSVMKTTILIPEIAIVISECKVTIVLCRFLRDVYPFQKFLYRPFPGFYFAIKKKGALGNSLSSPCTAQ
jgi:hypothetical protein